MTMYHAVMIDETGCEFGADVEANSRSEAYDILHEDYPESHVDQLESPQDAADRECRMYERLEAEMDGDYSQWEYEREFG
jgi:hypothetical protein